MAPEPNTPFVLGFDLVFGGVVGAAYGGLVYLAFSLHPLGVYTRVLQWGVRLMLVMMPVQFVLALSNGAQADRPKLGVFLVGATISATLISWRVLRARTKRPQGPKQVLRRWLQPLDYAYGVALYLALIIGSAQAAADMSPADYGGQLGLAVALVLVSQLSAQFLFAFFSRAMRDDYQPNRGWHHVLVGLALVAAVVADVIIGVSPAGPIFSVLLLWASWRYTDQRPASALKTLGYLRASHRARRVAT
jgi:hypothetical protein